MASKLRSEKRKNASTIATTTAPTPRAMRVSMNVNAAWKQGGDTQGRQSGLSDAGTTPAREACCGCLTGVSSEPLRILQNIAVHPKAAASCAHSKGAARFRRGVFH